MSQMPGGPMGGDFGPIFGGPFGGRMRRMPFPPINRGTIFRPRPPIYSPGGPNKGGTQAPIPRFPSRGSGASNFYRSPMYNPGVPSGLSALLSGRPSRFGSMTDLATGFPQRTSGKGGGSKGSARTVRPSEQEPVMDRQPIPDFGMGEGGNEMPTIPTDLGRRFDVGRPQPDIVQSVKIDPDILDRGTVYRPPNQISNDRPMITENPMFFGNNPPPSPVRDFTGSPPPMMDASQRLRTDPPIMRSLGPESLRNRVESDLRFGEPASSRNADGSLRVSQPIMPRSDLIPAGPARPVSQTPEEAMRQRILAGNRRGTGLDSPPVVTAPRQVDLMPALAPPPPTPPRLTAQERTGFSGAMEQAGVRPNIRPTMNVGKATGGPVGIHSGIASLVGRR